MPWVEAETTAGQLPGALLLPAATVSLSVLGALPPGALLHPGALTLDVCHGIPPMRV